MEPILAILVVFLILFLIYWCVGKFIQGTPHQVIGVILGVVFLIYALKRLGVAGDLGL
ncbi:MAG TPA: hypothetical protein VHS96_13875 [Bacteroidia bacterium]|nr:hypothetical protein [Bacteroidia bacterium]